MPVQLLIALLTAAPQLYATAAEIRGNLSETDQAALDAAINVARTAALASVSQALADLDAASKT